MHASYAPLAMPLTQHDSASYPLRIEPTLHANHGACKHCGGQQQSVWGWAYWKDYVVAAYYVRWTAGSADEGMTFLVSIGPWGPGGREDKRRSVGLRARIENARAEFMVIEASATPWASDRPPMLGQLLTREQVVDTKFATEMFAYVDAIVKDDPRVARFIATAEGMDGHGG